MLALMHFQNHGSYTLEVTALSVKALDLDRACPSTHWRPLVMMPALAQTTCIAGREPGRPGTRQHALEKDWSCFLLLLLQGNDEMSPINGVILAMES